jgi:hypothetical protein
MGCVPPIAEERFHEVTIMITVINFNDNTPVLSMCQEGTGTGATKESGNIYRLGKVGAAKARIIYGGSSRNRAVAKRHRRTEPRRREAYLKQYVDRPSGEPACLDARPSASRLVAAANPRLQQKRS